MSDNGKLSLAELIHKGYVERSLMKTPNGGDYSEAHYFDEDWNYTTKDVAMHMVIKEFNSMREVINEIIMDRDVSASKGK